MTSTLVVAPVLRTVNTSSLCNLYVFKTCCIKKRLNSSAKKKKKNPRRLVQKVECSNLRAQCFGSLQVVGSNPRLAS